MITTEMLKAAGCEIAEFLNCYVARDTQGINIATKHRYGDWFFFNFRNYKPRFRVKAISKGTEA